MKKILGLVIILVLYNQVTLAESNLENYKWWKAETVEDVQKKIHNGLDIKAKDDNGKTALMKAAENSSPEVVKFLIDVGADVNAKDNQGETALMKAAKDCWYTDNVKILIDAGADINTKDNKGETAWYKAATHLDGQGCPKIEKILEKAGAKTSKMKIGLKKTTEGVEKTVAKAIVVPFVLTGAAVYSVTHGTSFDKGLSCMLFWLWGGCY